MKTKYGYEVKFKDPVKLDEQKLKQLSCSHISYRTHEDGEIYCDTCRLGASDVEDRNDDSGLYERRFV